MSTIDWATPRAQLAGILSAGGDVPATASSQALSLTNKMASLLAGAPLSLSTLTTLNTTIMQLANLFGTMSTTSTDTSTATGLLADLTTALQQPSIASLDTANNGILTKARNVLLALNSSAQFSSYDIATGQNILATLDLYGPPYDSANPGLAASAAATCNRTIRFAVSQLSYSFGSGWTETSDPGTLYTRLMQLKDAAARATYSASIDNIQQRIATAISMTGYTPPTTNTDPTVTVGGRTMHLSAVSSQLATAVQQATDFIEYLES